MATTGIFFNIDRKVEKVAEHSLVADSEITKLSLYPAYNGEDGLDARITAIETAIGSGSSESSLIARMGAAETALQLLNNNASTVGSVAYAVATAKDTIDAYTVNGKAISTSPTLSGQDIAITGFTPDVNSVLSGISAASTVTAAIDKVDEVIASHDASLNTIDAVLNGVTNNGVYRVSGAGTTIANGDYYDSGETYADDGEHYYPVYTNGTCALVYCYAGNMWKIHSSTTISSSTGLYDLEASEQATASGWTEEFSHGEAPAPTVSSISGGGTSTPGLIGRVTANEAAIATLTGNSSTAGSIAKALADAEAYTDGKVSALGSVFNYKGTKADLATLEAVTEGNKVGDVWTVTNASGAAGDQNLEYVCIAVNSSTGAGTWERLGTNVNLSGYYTKVEVQAFTVNGKAIYQSPTLNGSDIALGSGYSAVTDSVLTGIATGSTIDAAFDKVDEVLKAHDTALDGIDTVLNGSSVPGETAYVISNAGTTACNGTYTKVAAADIPEELLSEDNNDTDNVYTNGSYYFFRIHVNDTYSWALREIGEATYYNQYSADPTDNKAYSMQDDDGGWEAAAGDMPLPTATVTSVGGSTAPGLISKVATNEAAIATLTGNASTSGSVANAVSAEATRAAAAETAINNKLSYEFINSTTTKDLEDKLYIVRNAKFTGTLPTGDAIPANVAIRVIVNEAASLLDGEIKLATGSSDTINGASTAFALDDIMDVTFIYDATNHDWVPIATRI